ncbi:MAG: dipeptidase [Polyangiaceae bacterium]|nr:dipeptidase [Polyangiaceae bacterium]
MRFSPIVLALSLAACSPEVGTALPSTTATEAKAPSATDASAAAASASAPSSAAVATAPRPDDPPRPIDLHVDTPWQVKFKGRAPTLPEGHATMETLAKGRYAAIVYPIYIADYLHDNSPTIADADEIYATIDTIIEKNSLLWPATKGAAPADKITAYVSIEGAGAFAADITQIDRFIARGVVLIGPVHAHDNKLATSATGADKKTGLTALGKKFCERVYENGALVDVSHMSDRAFDDLATIAEKVGAPIIATHSDARAIANSPRNLTDEQLKRIAKSDGVAGVNFHSTFLKVSGEAKLADAVKHAQHMIEVAGIDHVAIGSDFDGASPPSDLADASYLPAFAKALREAGVSAEDVHKIFSENAKRVLKWGEEKRAAKRAQK